MESYERMKTSMNSQTTITHWIARSCVFVTGALLISCGNQTETDFAAERLAQCGALPSLTAEELSNGQRLCEHQTLVASLTPDAPLRLPMRIVKREATNYCFRDDDAEGHRARIFRGEEIVVDIQDGKGCMAAILDPGDYELELTHGGAGLLDDAPDVVHTILTPASEGSVSPTSLNTLVDASKLASWVVSVNACPGCTLRGAWPSLLLGGGGDCPNVRGYSGDYEKADFSDSTCPYAADACCSIGIGKVAVNNFDGAKFDRVTNAQGITVFGTMLNPYGPGLSASFRGASFKALNVSTPIVNLVGDFTGADFSSATLTGKITDTISAYYINRSMTGAVFDDKTSFQGGGSLKGWSFDLPTYVSLSRRGINIASSSVTVAPTDTLKGITFDGAKNQFTWPTDPTNTGNVSLANADFSGSTLIGSGASFRCDGAGKGTLAGVQFINATLNDISLSGCQLSNAKFDGATITKVNATNSQLSDASFTGVSVAGLDLSGSDLVRVPFSTKTNVAATGVRMLILNGKRTTARLLTDSLSVSDWNLSGADLTDSDFSNAHMENTKFDSAILTRTNFTKAILDGAVFDGSTGTSPVFTNAKLRSGTAIGSLWAAPHMEGFDLTKTPATHSLWCGAFVQSAVFTSADLTFTLIPTTDNVYTFKVDGVKQTIPCPKSTGLDTVINDATTTCPNTQPGPCTGDAWLPPDTSVSCCTGLACPSKLAPGQPCTSACDCGSLVCTAGTCG